MPPWCFFPGFSSRGTPLGRSNWTADISNKSPTCFASASLELSMISLRIPPVVQHRKNPICMLMIGSNQEKRMGSLQDHITIVIEVIISSRNHQLVLIVINVCSYSYNPFIVIVSKDYKATVYQSYDQSYSYTSYFMNKDPLYHSYVSTVVRIAAICNHSTPSFTLSPRRKLRPSTNGRVAARGRRM